MRLILMLLFSSVLSAQVSTGNISQNDVKIEMATSPNKLTDMVTRANSTGGWHASYQGSKDRLSNFKGYNDSPGGGGTCRGKTMGYGINPQTACNDYTSSPSTYYLNNANFDLATSVSTNSSCTTNAPAGYYSDGLRSRYWSGSSFTTNTLCEGGA